MTDETIIPVEAPSSPLDMSDADVMNMELPSDPVVEEAPDTDESKDAVEGDEESPDTIEEATEEETDEEAETDVDGSDKSAESADTVDDPEDSDGDATSDNTTPDTDDDTPSELNYEDEHKKLLAPFKANGKEMHVDSVEDARKLMQMGANYNKKMAGLKPNLKLMKMLDNNNLLDESKLSYLIDLDKKNPKAIAKLIKESGLDPLDMDVTKDSTYQPSAYTVDDKEVELDATLDDIRGTDSYSRTIDVVSNKWDESSRKTLVENPAIINTINDHIASGIYDQISAVVDKKRMLGDLSGVPDLDAYKLVGDEMQANGDFNKEPKAPDVIKPKVSKAVDPKVSKRKKAASTTKSAPASKTPSYDPLSMSDEEFMKNLDPKFV